MATVVNPMAPLKPQGYRPSRPRTYPQLQPQKPAKKGLQFDAADLSRRLEAVLVEQKALSEKRRVARAAAAKKEQALKERDEALGGDRAAKKDREPYRYKPQVAAADSTRTSTSDATSHGVVRKKSAHKLALAALRTHTEETADISPKVVTDDLHHSKDRNATRAKRHTLGERTQFQRNRDLDIAHSLEHRQFSKSPQRSFGVDLLTAHRSSLNHRPFSLGDMIWEDDEHARMSAFPIRPKPVEAVVTGNDRQDWAQLDEIAEISSRSMRDRVAPLLRKTESLWALTARHDWRSPPGSRSPVPETGTKHMMSNREMSDPESPPPLPEVAVKHKKNGFLGRFSRRESRVSE